jgi:hypothetical protein
MSTGATDDDLIRRVDERSEKLIDEAAKYASNFPDDDQNTIFHSWAIQKIAGLQILAELINEHLASLGTIVANGRRPRPPGREG